MTKALHDARDISLPADFLIVSQRLGGTKADLASHIRVALKVIEETWENGSLDPVLRQAIVGNLWPAPGSEDTELGVLMEPEVGHGEAEVYARVQA